METPKFKYSPNAYKINVLEKIEGTCSVCNQARTLKYTGSFYSVDEPEYICPWCIADGSAAEKFDGQFSDAAGVEKPNGYEASQTLKEAFEEKIREVIQKTPGYISWQQEVWLSHCNEPCAFIDYADSEIIKPFIEELQDDIESLGFERDMIENELSKEGSVVGYLFQCLHCGKHRLHVDGD
jgi:uncharacterized protein CbrC (UPF0167 family)